MADNQNSFILNEVFPRLPKGKNNKLSNNLSVIVDSSVLDDVGHNWNRFTGKIYPNSYVFLSLMKFVEIVVLYDKIIPITAILNEEPIRPFIESGIVLNDTERYKFWQNVNNKSTNDHLKFAYNLYPKAFNEVQTIQDSPWRTFTGNVLFVCAAASANLPYVPQYVYEIESILIAKKLNIHRTISAINITYEDAVNQIYPSIQTLFNAQGTNGLLITPIIYEWLRVINKYSSISMHESMEILLSLRNKLRKTREYLREISGLLCDPMGSYNSYNKAMNRLSEIKKALVDMTNSNGERIFLLRLPDLKTIVPSFESILSLKDSNKIFTSLSKKTIPWWARRIRFRKVFHLFSLFNNYLDGSNINIETRNFLGSDEENKKLVYLVKKHNWEMKNLSQLKLIKDDEESRFYL